MAYFVPHKTTLPHLMDVLPEKYHLFWYGRGDILMDVLPEKVWQRWYSDGRFTWEGMAEVIFWWTFYFRGITYSGMAEVIFWPHILFWNDMILKSYVSTNINTHFSHRFLIQFLYIDSTMYMINFEDVKGRYNSMWYKVCQWLARGRWFSPDTSVSSTNKTDHHDILEILLKVVVNTITLTTFY